MVSIRLLLFLLAVRPSPLAVFVDLYIDCLSRGVKDPVIL